MPLPAKQVQRVDFAPLEPSARGLAGEPSDRPPGVVAAPMTADLLERCEWRDTVTGAAGSTEQFLRTGLGACLLLGDEIVAEAYAPYIGPGSAEVGVVTPERHRGQGYATLAVASLGAMLAARGLAMYWSCDADNDPSIRVAEKLGFVDRRPFTMALYRALATPP
jgi:RimJ/RimL family protein N-acetyltransferase